MKNLVTWILAAGLASAAFGDDEFLPPVSYASSVGDVRQETLVGGRGVDSLFGPVGQLLPAVDPDSLLDVLFPGSCPESLFDSLQDLKRDYHVPVHAEAWHWQHVNNGGSLGSGYGIPTIRGTYFWSLKADPEMNLDPDGLIQKVGVHSELRLREQDKFRGFFRDNVWFWERLCHQLAFLTSRGFLIVTLRIAVVILLLLVSGIP